MFLTTMILRFIITSIILYKGSVEDYRTRTAHNHLWLYLLQAGLILLTVDFIMGLDFDLLYLALTPVNIILFVLAFRFKIIQGGADTKALISLCVVFPFGPDLGMFPIFPGIYPFIFSLFFNACLVAAISIPFVKYFKKLDLRTLLTKYQYPFFLFRTVGLPVAGGCNTYCLFAGSES